MPEEVHIHLRDTPTGRQVWEIYRFNPTMKLARRSSAASVATVICRIQGCICVMATIGPVFWC